MLDRRALAAAADDLVARASCRPRWRPASLQAAMSCPPGSRSCASLLRGDTGHATMAVCADPICARLGRIVQRDLSSIGIDVRLVHVDDPSAGAARQADIALGGTAAPYRDALAFVARVLRDPIVHAPPTAARAVAEAAGLRDAPRDAAARALAARLEADAGLIAFGTPALPELFSGASGAGRRAARSACGSRTSACGPTRALRRGADPSVRRDGHGDRGRRRARVRHREVDARDAEPLRRPRHAAAERHLGLPRPAISISRHVQGTPVPSSLPIASLAAKRPA